MAEIRNIPIKELVVNTGQIDGVPKNPRFIKDDRYKKLVKSLQDDPEMLELRELIVYPFKGVYVIIGGNMRYRAMKELKYTEAPCKVLKKDTPPEKLRAYIIKDNVAFGSDDYDALGNEWDMEELEEWGMDLSNITTLEELEAKEDGYEIPDEIKTDIVQGDMFEFKKDGKVLHRLLCGDSTKIDDVERVMGGEKADVAHNDPPYGMRKESEGVLNDNLNFEDLLNFNNKWIPLQFSYIKDNGSWYCWGIDEPLMDIYSNIIKHYIKENKATFRNLITWDKGNGQGQNSENTRMYATADEKCIFIMMGVQGFNTNKENFYEGWENIRQYLVQEKDKMNWSTNDVVNIVGKTSVSHYFSKSQWAFPTQEHYRSMQNAANNAFKKEYNAFKKEYNTLKKEYYDTRAYFNNTHDNFNNVWKFERHIRVGDEGGHATPKPILLCERVIKSSCPDYGIVVDFF